MDGFTEESWNVASGHMRPQNGVAIRFELIPVKNEAKSDAEGKPVFEDVEYIEKRVPGDKLNIIVRKITDADRKEFREQYKHWKAGLEDPESGMPLKQWAPMTRSEVEEFAYHGVRTVEELSGMSDAACKGIGAGVMKRRDMALDWLKQAAKQAPATHLRGELEKRDSEISALRNQMAELIQLTKGRRSTRPEDFEDVPEIEPVAAPLTPAPKKRGRPAKSTQAAQE